VDGHFYRMLYFRKLLTVPHRAVLHRAPKKCGAEPVMWGRQPQDVGPAAGRNRSSGPGRCTDQVPKRRWSWKQRELYQENDTLNSHHLGALHYVACIPGVLTNANDAARWVHLKRTSEKPSVFTVDPTVLPLSANFISVLSL